VEEILILTSANLDRAQGGHVRKIDYLGPLNSFIIDGETRSQMHRICEAVF